MLNLNHISKGINKKHSRSLRKKLGDGFLNKEVLSFIDSAKSECMRCTLLFTTVSVVQCFLL